MSNPCPYLSYLGDQGSGPVRDPVRLNKAQLGGCLLPPRPLSRVHAPFWANLVGEGAGQAWESCSHLHPCPVFSITDLREVHAGRNQGYLWEGFSRQLGVPPRPKWQPGDMHCYCWGLGTPGCLQGPLGSVVVQSLSCGQLFATPWTAARQASLSFTISWSLLKLMSTESVMPSNHLILCYPLLLLPSVFPSIRVFSNELAFHFRLPKYWSFSISPSNEYSGLISFRIDWFDLGSGCL